MNSINHGDGVLELGAQWIHGRGDCPLWKFFNDNQIPGMFCQTNDHLYSFVCIQLPMMRVGMVTEHFT